MLEYLLFIAVLLMLLLVLCCIACVCSYCVFVFFYCVIHRCGAWSFIVCVCRSVLYCVCNYCGRVSACLLRVDIGVCVSDGVGVGAVVFC